MYDDFEKLLAEQMKDSEFKEEWEALEPEFNVIQAMIDANLPLFCPFCPFRE